MASGRHQKTRCRVCGASFMDEPISKRGYCREHGHERLLANNDQLMDGEGEWYDHWTRRSFMAVRKRVLAAQAQLAEAETEQA